MHLTPNAWIALAVLAVISGLTAYLTRWWVGAVVFVTPIVVILIIIGRAMNSDI